MLNLPCKPLTAQQEAARAEIMRRRINACCKGLVEPHARSDGSLASVQVDYLHRTVKDLWETENVWAKIQSAPDEFFIPYARLSDVYLARLKGMSSHHSPEDIRSLLGELDVQCGVRSSRIPHRIPASVPNI
jgi:hypothetical protein